MQANLDFLVPKLPSNTFEFGTQSLQFAVNTSKSESETQSFQFAVLTLQITSCDSSVAVKCQDNQMSKVSKADIVHANETFW